MEILFVHNARTHFVRLDIDILRQHHSVTEMWLHSRIMNPAAILAQVGRHDLIFGWFASWHTFLPILFSRMLGKPSLLVIGGYDLANLPEAGYGHQRGGLKKWISCTTMRLSRQLTTFSYFSQSEAVGTAGIMAKTVPVVIYLGVPDPFGALPEKNGRPLVLTVGNVWQENLWRKGLEPFVRAAAHLPDAQFVLVGAWRDDSVERLKSIATPNVVFTGWIEDEDLLDYYRRAHVYVQASAHEGFGMSVAEAMLAGCLPVVTKAGALPEVVGDCGIYSMTQDPAAVARAISGALQLPEEARTAARQRVVDEFSLQRRQQALVQLVEQVSNLR